MTPSPSSPRPIFPCNSSMRRCAAGDSPRVRVILRSTPSCCIGTRRIPSTRIELGWITLAWGPGTLVESATEPSGSRRLRYEVEFTNGTGEVQAVAAGVSSDAATTTVIDGLVTATSQRSSAVRTGDTFEVRVAPGAALDPASLIWTLSVGTRSEFALGVARTLDGAGQPLGDVAVEEQGPAGLVLRASEPLSGIATLAEQAGSFRWRFEKVGYLPVWREGTLAAGQVLLVPSPWLARRSEERVALSVLNGGTLGDGDPAAVHFAGGAFAAASEGTLSALDGQTLPGPLPPGWSPLAAFWLELSVEPTQPGNADLRLADRLAPGERAFLVRFDETSLRWIETGTPVAASGELATTTLATSGAYAVVVGDTGATAPPTPVAGQPLPATATPFPLPDGLAASGIVVPPVAPASLDPVAITAQAEIVLSHTGLLPSGFVLRGDVDERYLLRNGASLTAPSYETFFVAYQRPGDDDPQTLHARFPLRPLVAIGPDELDEASVQLGILPVSAFAGGFFDPSGGRVGTPGVLVSAPPGAVDSARVVEVRGIDPSRFADLAPSNALLFAFDLAADGLLPGARLGLGFGPQEPDAAFVVARFVQSGARSGLEPRERFTSDAGGVLRSAEPKTGPRLPGVTGSGQYVLVRVGGPQALVEGVARDTQGRAAAGLAVEIEGEPWLTFSHDGGEFQLVASPGDRTVVVTDLRNGDRGTQSISLADPSSVGVAEVATQPAGPRVLDIDPADGATAVSAATPVRVRFSEPVAPLVPGDLALRDASGELVPATFTSNLGRTEATLLPIDPLASGQDYTLTLASTISDPSGLPIEGSLAFSFSTAAPAARGAGAQVTAWEPGAATAACDDVPGIDRTSLSIACVVGSQGTADPDVPVILVNDSTGTTATVRSRVDGSFEGFIDADVDDFVSATFVNTNGTRVRIPVQRQLFDDGSVALFEGGGILEAESDGGPVQILVQPGSIPNKTKFKVDPLPLSEVLALAQSSPPETGQLLSAVSLTVSGDVPTESPEVVLPIDEAQLQLQPGEDPATHAFALAAVTDADAGGKAYRVLDNLHYEDGNLVTHSFPFLGLALFIGQAVVEEFASIVITSIFLGGDAITTTGIVGACQLTQVTGACIGEGGVSGLVLGGPDIRPLPGAVVVAQPFEPGGGLPPVSARPGRIPTGAVYAVADKDGRYVLALALINDAFGAIGREQAFQLVATHPRFAEPTVDIVVFNDFTLFNPLVDRVAAKDLLFRVANPFGSIGELAQAGRPKLSVGHDPLRPPPEEPAELRIFSSHRQGTPVISVAVAEASPLVVGDSVAIGDIALQRQSSETPGSDAVREVWTVEAPKPAAVKLVITATVDGAEPAIAEYPIHFGGSPPVVTNPVKAADPNDERGPFVLRAWPPEDSEALAPGEPIFLAFNEAVSKSIEEDGAGITLTPDAGEALVELDPTQREATIRFPALKPDTSYTLTVTSAVQDLAEPPNGLDQDPTTNGDDSFQLHFETTPVRTRTLPGVSSGGGAVLHGDYAFVLDRDAAFDGTLRVYDVSNPDAPTLATSISLPGYPRDMALIGSYQFKRKDGGAAETRDLLAIVGGGVGGGSDEDGNVNVGNAYFNLIDITNPTSLQRVAGALLSLSASTTATKVAWSPPLLSYLLSDADVQQIDVLNLQTFLIGSFATPEAFAAFPEAGREGDDKNGDGDFADDEDVLPLPPRDSSGIAGKEQSFLLDETNQRILDYFFDANRVELGLALSDGKLLDSHGQPTATAVPPGYRTFANNAQLLDRVSATVDLAGTRPKRVHILYGVSTRDTAGLPIVADLALVSLAPASGGVPSLAVIDVSDPTRPTLLTKIELPSAFGIPQSIAVRDDGQVVLASTNDLLLLDPTHFGDPQPSSGPHPAILGQVDGAGSGARAFSSEASGYNVVSLGGKSQLVQSAPTLSFVQFPLETALVDPSALAGDADLRDTKLAGMTGVGALAPARLRGVAGAAESLDPPSPAVHYHVLVRAPGSAGATIEIGLESLDVALEPIPRKGFHFAPTQALRETTLSDMGQTPRSGCDAPSNPLRAFRLAADPRDPLYDVYLSTPFALTTEEVKEADLKSLRANPEREILWSGYFLRAVLEPSLSSNPQLSPWAAEVKEKRLRPRANVFTRTLPGDYIVGSNPPPPNGYPEAPGTMGSVAAHSGELRTSTVDLSVDARLLPIVFERFSSSQDLYVGPFGRGWDFEYNQRIIELREDVFPPGNILPLVDRGGNGDEVAEAKDLLFHTGEATTVIFAFKGEAGSPPPEFVNDPLLQQLGWLDDAAAFYVPTDGVFDALVRFQDGTFGRLTPDGMQYRYSPDGKLEKIYHRYEDNALELQYNTHGELIRVQESEDPQRYIDVGYYRLPGDSEFRTNIDVITSNAYHDGKIAKLIDFTDRDVEFYYDATGLLERRDGVNVTASRLGGETGRARTRYVYGQCTEGSSTNNLTTITSGAGSGTPLFSVSGFSAGQHDVARNGTGIGGPVQISLGQASTAEALAQGGATSTITEPDGSTSSMLLDDRGLPTKITLAGTGGDARDYQYVHTPDGRVEMIGEPAGNAVEYSYDDGNQNLRSRGNLIKIRRTAGALPGGDLEATFAYDASYNQQSGTQTDFGGNALGYTLTDNGRQVGSISYPGVGSETFTFNGFGQVTTHDLPDGVQLGYGYDDSGYLKSEQRGGFTATYTYTGDAGDRGNPTSITPAHGAQTSIVYDELDRPIAMTRSAYTEEFGYDPTGRVKAHSRTADSGNKLIQRDVYDARGFRTSSTLEGVEVDGSPTSLVTTFTPDSLGRVETVQRPGGVTESLEYDHLDNITSRTFGSMVTTTEFDDNGNPKKATSDDLEIQYVYDAHDRLHKVITPSATTTYEYFGNGELEHLKVDDGDVIQDVAYEVDALGRITKVTEQTDNGPAETRISYSGLTTTQVDPANQTTTTVRGSDGWIRSIDNGAESIIYTRNGKGGVESETSQEGGRTFTRSFVFDDLEHPTSMTFGGVTTGITPRPDGAITAVTNGLGRSVDYQRTLLGEVKQRRTPEGVLLNYRYAPQRDSSGLDDAMGPALSLGYDTSLRQTTTTYRDGGTATYSYSGTKALSRPNTVAIPGGSITPTYDPEGRLLAQDVSFGSDTRQETFTYDGLGRILTATYPGGSASYDYDKLGPLRSAVFTESAGSKTVRYGMRSDGKRTSVDYPSGTTVTEQRDAHGRLEAVLASSGGAVIDQTTYAGADIAGMRSYGGGIVVERNEYDDRKRLLARRYENATGQVLAEERVVYDDGDNVVARQFLHRGGRADFFGYDRDDRLTRADIGARPQLGIAENGGALAGFTVPAGVPGTWSRGLFARDFGYDGSLDLFESATPVDPDGLAPPFATSRSAPDGNLQPQQVDYGSGFGSFARGAGDDLGNTVRTLLFVRTNAGGPIAGIGATLHYDGLANLTKIERDDGATIEYSYQHTALIHERKVTCAGGAVACVPTHTAYVYDGGRRLEEYDASSGAIIARYYYADDDFPIAADLRTAGAGLARHYLLVDSLGSVMAIADATGAVIERIGYDAWGEPHIEAPDAQAPVLAQIQTDASGAIVIQFSERVQGALSAFGPGKTPITAVAAIATKFRIRRTAWSYRGRCASRNRCCRSGLRSASRRTCRSRERCRSRSTRAPWPTNGATPMRPSRRWRSRSSGRPARCCWRGHRSAARRRSSARAAPRRRRHRCTGTSSTGMPVSSTCARASTTRRRACSCSAIRWRTKTASTRTLHSGTVPRRSAIRRVRSSGDS